MQLRCIPYPQRATCTTYKFRKPLQVERNYMYPHITLKSKHPLSFQTHSHAFIKERKYLQTHKLTLTHSPKIHKHSTRATKTTFRRQQPKAVANLLHQPYTWGSLQIFSKNSLDTWCSTTKYTLISLSANHPCSHGVQWVYSAFPIVVVCPRLCLHEVKDRAGDNRGEKEPINFFTRTWPMSWIVLLTLDI
jgi:hypothetical protein